MYSDAGRCGLGRGRARHLLVLRAGTLRRMNYGEIEQTFERIEITITVQQRMPVMQAERRDEAVNRLADGVATGAEQPIIARGGSCQLDAARLEDLYRQQVALECRRRRVISNALQQLTQDDVRHAQSLAIQFDVQPIRLRILRAVEIVDPDGGIDDHHRQLPARAAEARFPEITLPRHLAAQASDPGLAACTNQET